MEIAQLFSGDTANNKHTIGSAVARRPRDLLTVTEYFSKSLQAIRNDTVE